MGGGLIAFSVYHCVTDEVIFHATLFGSMILAVGFKTRSTIHERIKDKALRAQIMRLVWFGTFSFGLGWVLWNIDQLACPTLTAMKRWVGMPLSFLLELHGWWHVWTGIGAYCFIGLVEYLTGEEAGGTLEGKFQWPVSRFVKVKEMGGREVPRISRRGEYGTISAEESARED